MSNKNYNPVGWFEIYVNDMERATKFYETVFEQKLEDLPIPEMEEMGDMQMRAFPMIPDGAGAAGTLVKMKYIQGGGTNVIIYFSCDDCANEESRVEAAGGKVQQAKMSIGDYGFCSIVVDTEGNTIGLHSLK